MELDFRIDDTQHLSIVRGEDRTFKVRVLEKASVKPVSLSGATVAVRLACADGRVLERSSAGKAIESITGDSIALEDHGHVDGDVVQLTTTGTLPTGLYLATNYYVVESTKNALKLSATLGGSAITPTGGSGTHTIGGLGITLTSPAELGEVSVDLHDLATAVLQSGVMIDGSLSYKIGQVTRVIPLLRAFTIRDAT